MDKRLEEDHQRVTVRKSLAELYQSFLANRELEEIMKSKYPVKWKTVGMVDD